MLPLSGRQYRLYADTVRSLTRDQVRAQLAALEQVGYQSSVDSDYPRNLRRAESVLAQKRLSD
ncbi:hypothetical protein BURKHO8Y_580033 [Burkholderia sp. 8Y]|uniref:DUF4148 domain-containing protein n=1 Tax=Burkholderia sp. 8Y TaxID=2653133 RepID=UPI0012F42C6E|nr:hypothetical protein BURKHO8Y_580033 [Burkholderia sp. 8Y]